MSRDGEENAKRRRLREWREKNETDKLHGMIGGILGDLPRQHREQRLLNTEYARAKEQITANIRRAGWLESWTVAHDYRKQAETRLLAWYKRSTAAISDGKNVSELPPPPAPPNIEIYKRRVNREHNADVKRRIRELEAKRELSPAQARELKSLKRLRAGLAKKLRAERESRSG